jgi:hypothetical protein
LQPPEQLPSHVSIGACPLQVRPPAARQSAWTSAETLHEPSHVTSTLPGLASTSHSAAALAVTSSDASQRAGSAFTWMPASMSTHTASLASSAALKSAAPSAPTSA